MEFKHTTVKTVTHDLEVSVDKERKVMSYGMHMSFINKQ